MSEIEEAGAPSNAPSWEPWHCSSCGFFVYNTDEFGRPVEGAPSPRYISKFFPVVCSACWTMYVTLDRSEYFTKIQREDLASDEDRAKRIKKLRPGSDYLGA